MNIEFKVAEIKDAETISELVMRLTEEICVRTNTKHFDIDISGTINRCNELLNNGLYGAILGYKAEQCICVATFTESYALYAGGKIGIIPEFYVEPKLRSSGVGTMLIEAIREYGRESGWDCIELCTPPLPEFDRTLSFYEKNGLIPVGGRKMRQYIERK